MKTESRRKSVSVPCESYCHCSSRSLLSTFLFLSRFSLIRPMCHLSPFVLPPGHFHSPMCLSPTLSPLLRAGHKQVRQSADRVKTILSLFRFLHCDAPLTRETAYSKTIKSHFEAMDFSRARTDSATDL